MFHSITVPKDNSFDRSVVHYQDVHSFLESEDLIGELNFRKDYIENIVDTFTLDQMVHLVINKIMAKKNQWKLACSSVGVTSPLKSIFLLLDGDTPCAKYSTVRTRKYNKKRSVVNKILDLLKCSSENCFTSRTDVESKILPRMAVVPTAGDKGETARQYKGSIQHFLQKRQHQHMVANLLTQLLPFSNLPQLEDTTIYLITGNSSGLPYPQCVKLCGTYNHPSISSLKESIPYMEADLLMPYVWSKISSHERQGCILSKDTDTLVTLFALGDAKLKMLQTIPSPPKEFSIFPNYVAFQVADNLKEDPARQLEIMLHLTMGGTDYVEKFPMCGSTTLLNGLSTLEQNIPIFSNVNFVRVCDLTPITWRESYSVSSWHGNCNTSFELSKIGQGSSQHIILKKLIHMKESYFPIRLGNKVYIVNWNSSSDGRPREWYARRCPRKLYQKMTSTQAQKFDRDQFASMFSSSMKRRLFFLSMMSDCRVYLENDMLLSSELAQKCGYNFVDDFSYENPMILTRKSVL